MEELISVYVHIPFCQKKCAYCDFASFAGSLGKVDAYLTAIEKEVRDYGARFSGAHVKSLYVGGGTPTLLGAAQIARLFQCLSECFTFTSDAEITIEGNPGTLKRDALDACVSAGVNRLSLGMQAHQDALLSLLGRIHRSSEVASGVNMAREAGLDNISLDLMYGLPNQTLEMWSESLEAALALGIEHISCYELILEDDTPLKKRVDTGELLLPSEDTVLQMAQMALDKTKKAGMHRYEVSNYAFSGNESRHNKVYWACQPYIGLGCAAHGYVGGERYANTSDLNQYIDGGGTPLTREPVSAGDAQFERLMLGLRMTRGVDLARFERDFSVSVQTAFEGKIERLISERLLSIQDGFLSCTAHGMNVLNSILVELLD